MMSGISIEQAMEQLKQAQNDPQALTLATAQIACAPLHPELFDILQVAAIPHWFDAHILAHLLQTDIEQASHWLRLLEQLPMVENYAARNAHNVHETTRLALRASLAANESERFRHLSGLCADYFSATEDFQQIERIYHLLSGMTAGADQILLALYHNWRGSGRYNAQQTLSLVLEELVDGKLLEGAALARTLVVNGWIRGSRLSATLTETLARQAVELFSQAKDEYGEADARDWLGSALQTAGKLKHAMSEFRSQFNIMRSLTERDPDNSDWLRDLSVSHNKIGNVLQDQGNLAEALEAFRACMDISRNLAARDPDNNAWLRDLSVSHNFVGGVLQAQGNLAGALREYQASMDIRCRLSERGPDNSDWLRDLSVSHHNVGHVLQAQGNLAGALEAFRACMDIRRNLAERDPDNSDWLRELSVSHNCVGRVLQAQGNLAGALEAYQAGMDIMRNLTERDPDNSGWLRDLAVMHYHVASILEEQNQFSEALRERETDLEITERLATQDTTNQTWQQDLQTSRKALAALKQRIAESGN